jgi:hypothetical protein
MRLILTVRGFSGRVVKLREALRINIMLVKLQKLLRLQMLARLP